MKLLFDHNISPDLARSLRDLFPGSDHVFRMNLHELDDASLWAFARDHEFTIVSKDADFAELSMVLGFPPKFVWLRIGNCRTSEIETLIRANSGSIVELLEDDERGILSLFGKGVT